MLLRVGDVIKQAKPMPQFDFQGMLFTVINLSTEGVITIENPTLGRGVMDYSAFAQFFEIWVMQDNIEETDEPPKRTWSEWQDADDYGYDMYQFKENGKRLVVRNVFGGMTASASCHPSDTFDIAKGLKLAVARVIAKAMAREVAAIKASM